MRSEVPLSQCVVVYDNPLDNVEEMQLGVPRCWRVAHMSLKGPSFVLAL